VSGILAIGIDNFDFEFDLFFRVEEVVAAGDVDDVTSLQSNVSVLSDVFAVEVQHLLVFPDGHAFLRQCLYIGH
jgi:hypothetical protein